MPRWWTNRGRYAAGLVRTHVRAAGFARAGVVCHPVEKSDVVVALRPGRTIQKGVRARDRKARRVKDGRRERGLREQREAAGEIENRVVIDIPCRRRLYRSRSRFPPLRCSSGLVAEMAVGAQIDTSERETGSAKIPLLNGDQVHEATKMTGQYRY